MARMTGRQASRWLGYCETELTRDGLNPERRGMLEEKAAFYRRFLDGKCRRCGRVLRNEESRERGLGSCCASKVAAVAS